MRLWRPRMDLTTRPDSSGSGPLCSWIPTIRMSSRSPTKPMGRKHLTMSWSDMRRGDHRPAPRELFLPDQVSRRPRGDVWCSGSDRPRVHRRQSPLYSGEASPSQGHRASKLSLSSSYHGQNSGRGPARRTDLKRGQLASAREAACEGRRRESDGPGAKAMARAPWAGIG